MPGRRDTGPYGAPTVRALLDRLEPAPALLLNRLSDVLACTEGTRGSPGPSGCSTAARPTWHVSSSPTPGAYRLPDWDRVADSEVAALKQGRSSPTGTSRCSPTS
ncbi:hypothetical protein NKH77_53650 [Streptomyces sp. M19]